MLELPRMWPFFKAFERDYSQVVLNIEILLENKLAVDASFHQPKRFVVSYNNLLHTLLFFSETMTSLGTDPLKRAADDFLQSNGRQRALLARLRNLSAHQRLIVPEEAFSSGLYRLKSCTEAVQKIGIGELEKPFRPSVEYAMRDTRDVFEQLVSFHYLAFMDTDHAALGECLGVTRKWYYRVDFTWNGQKLTEVADIYGTAVTFAEGIIDHVCAAYADSRGLQVPVKFGTELPEFNYVNTMMEIDLYPGLFDEWWGGPNSPFNYGCSLDYVKSKELGHHLGMYQEEYKRLSADPKEYLSKLDSFIQADHTLLADPQAFDEYLGFAYLQAWHLKKALSPISFISSGFKVGALMDLIGVASTLLHEARAESPESMASLDVHMKRIGLGLAAIRDEVLRVWPGSNDVET